MLAHPLTMMMMMVMMMMVMMIAMMMGVMMMRVMMMITMMTMKIMIDMTMMTMMTMTITMVMMMTTQLTDGDGQYPSPADGRRWAMSQPKLIDDDEECNADRFPRSPKQALCAVTRRQSEASSRI